MDELKLLIEMVANLPAMAMWVLVGFFAYKVCIIGSIYGVIRLGIIKMHDWLTHGKTVKFTLGGKALDEAAAAALNGQLARLTGTYGYFSVTDVAKLKAAIDIMETKK